MKVALDKGNNVYIVWAMAEEENNDAAENEASEEVEETSEDGGKKRTWIWVVIGAVIILIIVGLVVASSQSESVSGILKVINVQPTTETPTPTPTSTPTIPEEGNSIISGTVSVTGAAPAGSTIGIARKSTNTGNWSLVVEDLLPRATDVPWTWASAVDGVTYEMQAVLISEDGDLLLQSQVSKVKAPASQVSFEVIVSELSPPPDNSLTIDCVDRSPSNAKWRVSFTYNINNPNTDANQYRLGIGTSPTADLVMDTITRPKSPDTTQSYQTDYIIDQGTQYYGAYAYATCSSCAEFSAASDWIPFICTEEDAASPTPTTAATSTPTKAVTPTTAN